MTLRLRQGREVYLVELPPGSRLQELGGQRGVLVPGRRPQDTVLWLSGPEVLRAARHGRHGLGLRVAAARD